ncbi:hypothetical protein [Halobaculum roseum]|uniref:Tat (Twin-arginine translocation) pathway signal sequence n=1 Tax=Halobaculum roseum TaxID=2175149 RepID=A0ABD5MQP9_9EURY|nr:hypothetical protein [Halobaculum roseum]QZY03210.1 hypothetical protein K6T36_03230 [Halobaculum roseum]
MPEVTRRGLLRKVGATGLVGGGGVVGSVKTTEASWPDGSISIRGFDIEDSTVYPDEGDGTHLVVELENTYDEEKVAWVIPYLFSEDIGEYHDRMYLEPGVLGGNAVTLSPNEQTEERFRWVPPLELDPGIYGIELKICEDNSVSFWGGTYDQWTIHDAIAAGFDVDTGCYGAIEQYQQNIRSSGGPNAPGVMGLMSAVSLIYSQQEVWDECGSD